MSVKAISYLLLFSMETWHKYSDIRRQRYAAVAYHVWIDMMLILRNLEMKPRKTKWRYIIVYRYIRLYYRHVRRNYYKYISPWKYMMSHHYHFCLHYKLSPEIIRLVSINDIHRDGTTVIAWGFPDASDIIKIIVVGDQICHFLR